MNCFWQRFHRQRLADLETFRQVAEKGGAFFGQNAGQPMSHAGQDEFASARGFEPPLHKWMPNKHSLGAVGEFVRQSLAHLMGEGGGAG
jgi:hypothetical protein